MLGLISFLLGLYGTAQLPVTAAGVLLLVLAMALFIAEAHFNSHGILGAGGVIVPGPLRACCSSTPTRDSGSRFRS